MKVIEICVVPDEKRIKLTVEMPDPDRFLTSQVPHLPKSLFRLFPRMAMHKCDNGLGLSFRQECRRTELPHLFEHLIIELQSQVQPAEVLRGVTEWNWTLDPRGRFHVTVDFENELLAIGAIRLAEKLMDALDRRVVETIRIDEEMKRLRELAQIGLQLLGESAAPRMAQATAASRSLPAAALVVATAIAAPEPPARRSWASVTLSGDKVAAVA